MKLVEEMAGEAEAYRASGDTGLAAAVCRIEGLRADDVGGYVSMVMATADNLDDRLLKEAAEAHASCGKVTAAILQRLLPAR